MCAHPQRLEIDALLRADASPTDVGRRFDLNRVAVFRQRANHLVDVVREAVQVVEQLMGEVPSAGPAAPSPPSDKKAAFLEHYAATGDLRAALHQAHINRVTLRKWQERDEAFSLRFNQADAEAVENLESEARIRAVTGSKMTRKIYRNGVLYEEIHEYRPSDAMLVKLLQAARPEKYGDKLTVTQTTVVKAIDAQAWEAV